MTATELAAVIVTISSVVAAVVLVFGLIAVNRTLKELRRAVDELRTETAPVIAELRDTVHAANYELNRVDDLLGTAESIGEHGRLGHPRRPPRLLDAGDQEPGGGLGHRPGRQVLPPAAGELTDVPTDLLAVPRRRRRDGQLARGSRAA